MLAPVTIGPEDLPEVLTLAHVHRMQHPGRTAYVQLAFFDQWRIILCEQPRGDGDDWQGHGPIIRQCSTYESVRAVQVLAALIVASDPDGLLEEIARPWNCDGPGAPIKLDARPGELRLGPWAFR
jgi:hypothetical protein